MRRNACVRLRDHAPIHHPDPLGLAVFFLHLAHDGLDGAHIGAIAGKHLETQRQSLGRANQADADLFVATALIARVAALGLGIALRLALEVGARHIVEQKLEAHAKPLSVTRHQMAAQRVLVRAELVQRAVEPVVVDQARVDAEQIVERGRVIPMLGHAEFGALRAKPRDGEQRGGVRPADALAPDGQKPGEQLVELEPMPQGEGQVTLAEVAAAFHAQRPQIGRLPTRRGVRRRGALRAWICVRSAEAGQRHGERPGRRSLPAQQRRQVVPAPAQTRQFRFIEFAKRGDHLLTRPARGAHRPAQVPVTVTDTTRRLRLTSQEHAGSIAETRPLLNGVFGTTCLQKPVFPRKRPSPKIRPPLNLFSPTSPTAELGLVELR